VTKNKTSQRQSRVVARSNLQWVTHPTCHRNTMVGEQTVNLPREGVASCPRARGGKRMCTWLAGWLAGWLAASAAAPSQPPACSALSHEFKITSQLLLPDKHSAVEHVPLSRYTQQGTSTKCPTEAWAPSHQKRKIESHSLVMPACSSYLSPLSVTQFDLACASSLCATPCSVPATVLPAQQLTQFTQQQPARKLHQQPISQAVMLDSSWYL